MHTLGGCQLRQLCGMAYNPFVNNWNWSRITSVNYALHATKSSQVVTDDVLDIRSELNFSIEKNVRE